MNNRKIWIIAAALAIIAGTGFVNGCKQKNPTDDSSRFVAITDMVPDAIL